MKNILCKQCKGLRKESNAIMEREVTDIYHNKLESAGRDTENAHVIFGPFKLAMFTGCFLNAKDDNCDTLCPHEDIVKEEYNIKPAL